MTGDENVTFPLTNSIELWRHPSFDPKKNTVVLITGWTTDINETNTAVDLLSEAYLARGDTNFVFIDTARYVDTLYAWSAFNTQELGEAIGEGLALLAEFIPNENIHVIGEENVFFIIIKKSKSRMCSTQFFFYQKNVFIIT